MFRRLGFVFLLLGAAVLLAFLGLKRPNPLPGVGQDRANPSPQADGAETIRILSWNVQWFPGRSQKSDAQSERLHAEAVASELRIADADIVCLQEVKGEDAINRLLTLTPEYRMQVVSDFQGAQETAIISRMDAVTAYAEEFVAAARKPPRGFAHAAFDFGGHRLLLYCVHFKSNVGGIAQNIPVREESARQLLDHVEYARKLHRREGARSVSVVLAGDFNTSLISEEFREEATGRMILEAGFGWGFRDMPENQTITWLSDGRYPDATFDHIFFQMGAEGEPGAAHVLPTDRSVSDHRPVVMNLALPGS